MSPTRALRLSSLVARPSLSTVYRAQTARPLAINQIRTYAAKGEGEKEDLGGPGGQEPPDPTARAQQNSSLRNKTFAGMILLGVPFFYLVSRSDRAPNPQSGNSSAAAAR